ncbi:glycosyltransferase [Snodgrassella sp. ESL0324]|uniref:glycosyltransferase n=1 Tax=Snodgrassella sp. ESL0324 TaxID=2705033 RepID=UPI001582C249|nr:glycosyltransferase [Snodgrassella sp. ESL0324]NUF08989.1 glycosyltransferase [Snodgrassella sp. ESL0324]
MLKRIQSSKFVKIKLLGLTIYKRDTDSERQYILKSLLTIKKNQTHKTIRLLGIKIYSKKIITNKKKSDNLNQTDNLWFVPTIPSDDDWNRLSPCKYTHSTRCVVVLPVYKGLNETLCSVFHALKSRISDSYSLLVINDCGPDEELNIKLQQLSEKGLFDYYCNKTNLGFVKTVNYAITHLSHNLDVILLNSDAFVFPGWFEKMIRYADQDESIATITPMSNNATICSYPFTNYDNNKELEITPAQLNNLASEINKNLYVETPTGVGFCFYMRRTVIDKIGLLDDVHFKVGYGEENDFCMRAIHAGFKNIIIGDVFVFHVGSVSFSATKEENMKRGANALKLKHPNYNYLVQNFINVDPPFLLRANLDLARLKFLIKNQKCIVFISHNWGGGINTYLEQIINKYTNESIFCIVLTVHDRELYSISLEKFEQLDFNNLKNLSLRGNLDFLNLFFKTIDPDLVHINSFAGLDWYYHQKLLTYFSSSNLKYKFVIHDYACMSNDYTLLSPEYIYEKEPSLEKRNIWNNFKTPISNLNMTDVFERQAVYADFFHNCSIIEAPSKRARDIILSDFPDLNINVIPHDSLVKNILPARRSKEIGKIKIATIGAIGLAKGSQLLSALALDSQTRDLNLTYFVVGYVNAALKQDMKKNGISISGKFQNENECINILREISPDIVLLPSICEETFCYTLSIVLALKIPTIVFDIGAQSERTQEFDWVIRLNPSLMSNPRAISDIISRLNIDDLWEKANS